MQWSEYGYYKKEHQSQGCFRRAWLPRIPATPAAKGILEV